MNGRIKIENLLIEEDFVRFINTEVLPGTSVNKERFWKGFSDLVQEFDLETKELVKIRYQLQKEIDNWCTQSQGKPINLPEYKEFLKQIGYLVNEGPDFWINSQDIDEEIATIPGPQLVVPVTNARFAINAVNARWNSLYDALYGTDVLGPRDTSVKFDAAHGKKVIAWVKGLLDETFPLATGSYNEATAYTVKNNSLIVYIEGQEVALKDPSQFVGFEGAEVSPTSLLLRHNGIHLQFIIDRDHPIGILDPGGLANVILESAITTILDCEDSVAVVDLEDKIHSYRNLLGIIKGELQEEVSKNGQTFTRTIAKDKVFKDPNGNAKTLKGLSLVLIRNTAAHVLTDIVLDENQKAISETIIDSLCTPLIALHDIQGKHRYSKTGSIYIVKPKMHGPSEVEQANRLFARVEEILGLPKNTIKVGIMDEERRTTLNLKECIRAVKDRVAFINTGFLDRTGDEIHTSTKCGPFKTKVKLKEANWLLAYEDWNVDVGLMCGLKGKAQIGKGMWAMPDLMKTMLEKKIEHPLAGANTAWVPSPTAATLHATHYLTVNVIEQQNKLLKQGRRADLGTLLEIPIMHSNQILSTEEIVQEVRNNLQGILGYVVRWVDQGIGCSKIPDINNVGLMEDRATCRISSQHIVNWLEHGIISPETVENLMREMAKVVDEQNQSDPDYTKLSDNFEGEAYKAALDLIFDQYNQQENLGYTELILHRRRQNKKATLTNKTIHSI